LLKKTILGLKNRDMFENKIGVIYLYYDNFQDIELRDFTHQVKDGNLIIDHKHPLSAETHFIIPLE
jgi:hypothetical protein